MKGWDIYSLGSKVKFFSGGTPSKDVNKYWNGEIPWVSSSEMVQRRIWDTQLHITEDGAKKGSRIVPKNTVLIVVRGMSLAKEFRVAITKRDLAFNQDLKALLPDEELDSNFLFYYLLSQNSAVKDSASEAAHGTKKLDMPVLEQWPVPLPPLPIQRKIAAILSAYDDLIENNNRRIAILDKMAEELYREWFVRLRFPGYEKVKIVKGVPEGWEVKRINDVVVRKGFGRIYRATELQPEGKIIVIDQSVDECLGYYDGEPEHIASEGTPIILFGDHSCKMQLMIKPFSLAENVIPFVAKGKMPTAFLFYMIHNSIETTEYKRHWTDLMNKEVYIPQEELQILFAKTANNHIIQKESLLVINRRIIKIRDCLLSRLMSGKIDVENLDIAFPQSMLDSTLAHSAEASAATPKV